MIDLTKKNDKVTNYNIKTVRFNWGSCRFSHFGSKNWKNTNAYINEVIDIMIFYLEPMTTTTRATTAMTITQYVFANKKASPMTTVLQTTTTYTIHILYNIYHIDYIVEENRLHSRNTHLLSYAYTTYHAYTTCTILLFTNLPYAAAYL